MPNVISAPVEPQIEALVAGLRDVLGPDLAGVCLHGSLATGKAHSKASAAAWALMRLAPEHRPVLERARAVYAGKTEDSWDARSRPARPGYGPRSRSSARLPAARRARRS